MILMTDFDKGDTVKVILEFGASQSDALFVGEIGKEHLATFFQDWLEILDVTVTKPEREWFFGDVVTLEDHPSGGFTFVDSESTDVSLCTHEQMRYLLNPASESYKEYGPYRLVAIHGIDLKVRGE